MEELKISVLMGIYNCADTLPQSIESILNQTYTNWELILCDDGSADETYKVADEYRNRYPDKIILIKNEKNMGLNYTLNHCLEMATGELIARQDGDDRSVPTRFERETAILKENPDYKIVSCSSIVFDEKGPWKTISVKRYPQPIDLIKGGPISHAPVMMWKYCMDEVGGYTVDKRMLRVEDVNLWMKLYAKGYRCINTDEQLYEIMDGRDAIGRRKYKYRINSTYARLQGSRMLGIGFPHNLYAFSPMIIGLIPGKVRRWIKKGQYASRGVNKEAE